MAACWPSPKWGWSAPERKDYDDFYARALDAVAWLQERGYHPFDQKNAVGPRPESLEPLRCLSTGKTVIYHTPYSPKYAAAGDGSLTDGLRGGWNYGQTLAGLARHRCRSGRRSG